MPIQITEEPWVPAQEKFETGPEYRSLEAGRMSRKRAREVEENGLEDEEMVDDEAVERLRKASRPTYKQVVGKASGRAWKAAATRASLIMKPRTGAQKSWDDRMKEKAAKKQFQATLKEAKDAGLAERKAEHTRRAAKKDQKEENRKRTVGRCAFSAAAAQLERRLVSTLLETTRHK
jgi:hypothetical protein